MEEPDTAQLVRDALAYVGGVNEDYLQVRCADGVVTLSGVAFADEQRREAENVASKVPGVKRVVNEIMVVKTAGA